MPNLEVFQQEGFKNMPLVTRLLNQTGNNQEVVFEFLCAKRNLCLAAHEFQATSPSEPEQKERFFCKRNAAEDFKSMKLVLPRELIQKRLLLQAEKRKLVQERSLLKEKQQQLKQMAQVLDEEKKKTLQEKKRCNKEKKEKMREEKMKIKCKKIKKHDNLKKKRKELKKTNKLEKKSKNVEQQKKQKRNEKIHKQENIFTKEENETEEPKLTNETEEPKLTNETEEQKLTSETKEPKLTNETEEPKLTSETKEQKLTNETEEQKLNNLQDEKKQPAVSQKMDGNQHQQLLTPIRQGKQLIVDASNLLYCSSVLTELISHNQANNAREILTQVIKDFVDDSCVQKTIVLFESNRQKPFKIATENGGIMEISGLTKHFQNNEQALLRLALDCPPHSTILTADYQVINTIQQTSSGELCFLGPRKFFHAIAQQKEMTVDEYLLSVHKSLSLTQHKDLFVPQSTCTSPLSQLTPPLKELIHSGSSQGSSRLSQTKPCPSSSSSSKDNSSFSDCI